MATILDYSESDAMFSEGLEVAKLINSEMTKLEFALRFHGGMMINLNRKIYDCIASNENNGNIPECGVDALKSIEEKVNFFYTLLDEYKEKYDSPNKELYYVSFTKLYINKVKLIVLRKVLNPDSKTSLDSALAYQKIAEDSSLMLSPQSLKREMQEIYLSKGMVYNRLFEDYDTSFLYLNASKQKYDQSKVGVGESHYLLNVARHELLINEFRKHGIDFTQFEIPYGLSVESVEVGHEFRKTEILNEQDKNRKEDQERLFVYAILLLIILGTAGYYFLSSKRKLELEKLERLREREIGAVSELFLTIIGHDTKGQLQMISNVNEILLNTLKKKSFKVVTEEFYLNFISRFEEVHNNIIKAKSILERMMFWVEPYKEVTVPLKVEEIKIEQIATEIFYLKKQALNEKDICLTINLEDTERVKADVILTVIILRNLIQNAIKYTQKGGDIWVTSKTDIENKEVIFCIKNKGEGVNIPLINDVLNFRVNKINSSVENTGLGLVICRNLVKKQNGKIWASFDNGNVSFSFSLPKTSQ